MQREMPHVVEKKKQHNIIFDVSQNTSQIGSSPQGSGIKINKIFGNHHPASLEMSPIYFGGASPKTQAPQGGLRA